MNKSQASRGYTLIELMIVVVVIAILAAIAYPAYTGYAIRAHRAVAQGDLVSAASDMERRFTLTGSYVGATIGNASTSTFRPNSPSDGSTVQYTLSFPVAVTATAFTIRATPVPGISQAVDGYLEINQLGVKRWDRNNDGDTADTGEDNWNN